MGADTKGFVLTSKKDVFKVYEVVRKSIVQSIMNKTGAKNWMEINQKDGYSIPNADIYENGLISIDFEYAGENRSLKVIFSCDHDYEEFRKGKKLILSLGCWGHSVPLMETALKALMSEYRCKGFIDENDCDLEDWREVR